MSTDKFNLRWVERKVLEEIPEGFFKCPDCDGTGKIKWRYDSNNDYRKCILCLGNGIISKADVEALKRTGWWPKEKKKIKVK